MKKTTLVLFIFFMTTFASVSEKKGVDDFIAEADNVSLELVKVTDDLKKCRIKYEKKTVEIEKLKNRKEKFFLLDFFYGLILKYHLGSANNLAYKINNLTKKQRELNNNYFTVVSLILTEYGEKIRNCIKSKCSDLKKLYERRLKWLDIIKNYENYIGLELAYDIFEKKYDKESKKDLIEYLEKKVIQVDQRIYLLEDELEINILLEKNGLKVEKNNNEEIIRKIKELKFLKHILKEKIKETNKI